MKIWDFFHFHCIHEDFNKRPYFIFVICHHQQLQGLGLLTYSGFWVTRIGVRAIAQAVSRLLPTAAARVRN
jgi:hypothetical protein